MLPKIILGLIYVVLVVRFNRGDSIFLDKDMLPIWTRGHILSHNIVYSHCFGKIVCLHDVKDRLKEQLTPRTAFHQKGEDDENMIPYRKNLLGKVNQVMLS